jgi:hypothetical protein
LDAGLDAQLVHEDAVCAAVGCERVGLPSCSIEGQHEFSPDPFPKWMAFDERLELGNELSVPSELEIDVDPILERRKALLLQPGDLVLGERLTRELDERRAAPKGESLAKLHRPLLRFDGPRLGHQSLEAFEVEVAGLDVEHVTARLPLERFGTEEPAERVNLVLKRRARRPGGFVPPEVIDEVVLREWLIGVQEQEPEKRPLLRSRHGEEHAVPANLERTEDPKVERRHSATLAPADKRLQRESPRR